MNDIRLLVISTFATDTNIYLDTGETEKKPGGPAYWIKRVYDRLNVPFELIIGDGETQVETKIRGKEPVSGRIITESRIVLDGPKIADGILVNTLDDFEIGQFKLLQGTTFLDVAPYTRAGKWRDGKHMTALPSSEIRSKIDIIKANEVEAPYLPDEWISEQKNERMLLHTLGAGGADLWERGKRTHFEAPKVDPKNLLGAGDTYGAAFFASYLTNGRDGRSACSSAGEVLSLLFN